MPQDGLFAGNQVFYRYVAETDSIIPILQKVKPSIVISAFRAIPMHFWKHTASCANTFMELAKLIFPFLLLKCLVQKGFSLRETDTPFLKVWKGKTKFPWKNW